MCTYICRHYALKHIVSIFLISWTVFSINTCIQTQWEPFVLQTQTTGLFKQFNVVLLWICTACGCCHCSFTRFPPRKFFTASVSDLDWLKMPFVPINEDRYLGKLLLKTFSCCVVEFKTVVFLIAQKCLRNNPTIVQSMGATLPLVVVLKLLWGKTEVLWKVWS